MTDAHGHAHAHTPHLRALRTRHTMLEQQIDDAHKHWSDSSTLRRLKVEKLRLKEEIEEEIRRRA